MSTIIVPVIRHIPLVRGDCLTVDYRMVDPLTGLPLDVTGYEARFAVSTKRDNVLIVLAESPTELTMGGAAGTIIGEAADSDTTKDWALVAMYYDFALRFPVSGCWFTQRRGDLLLQPSAAQGVAA